MTVVKSSNLIENLEKCLELAARGESILIPGKDNHNIVILSEVEYQELERAKRNAEYLAKLDRAIMQKNAGTMREHALIEV